MNMQYKINPVKATCMKFQGTEHGLVGINDTCFGICSAFSDCINTYDMNKQCSQACDAFVEKRKREIYGVGRCDHQAPYRPVIWEQFPRYVPQLLKKGLSPDQAKEQCMKLCDKNNALVASECKEMCVLDRNAIEEEEITPPSPAPPSPTPPEVGEEVQENYKAVTGSTGGDIGIIVGAVIGVIILLYILYKLFNKDNYYGL
jgi:hypothetical protein